MPLSTTKCTSESRSFSIVLEASGGATTISNATLVSFCDPGPLRDLLDKSYASDIAFMSAFCAKGGILQVSRMRDGLGNVEAKFELVGGLPTIEVSGGGSGAIAGLRLALQWSASA